MIRKFILVAALAVCTFGCRSVDVASQQSGPAPKCEIHGTQMHPEWIHVSTGYAGYVTGYGDIVRKRFPHHGGVILSGEREFVQPIDRRVRDFVCPDCTEAYRAYWRNARK